MIGRMAASSLVTGIRMRRRSKACQEYADAHTRCAICWCDPSYHCVLHVHHICGRRRGGGKHEICDRLPNLIVVCADCHHSIHAGGSSGVTFAEVLFAKKEEDGQLDYKILSEIRGRNVLPEEVAIDMPAWVKAARSESGFGWFTES